MAFCQANERGPRALGSIRLGIAQEGHRIQRAWVSAGVGQQPRSDTAGGLKDVISNQGEEHIAEEVDVNLITKQVD